jgi:hypothetical protein
VVIYIQKHAHEVACGQNKRVDRYIRDTISIATELTKIETILWRQVPACVAELDV